MRKRHRSTQRRNRHVPGQKPRGSFQERVKKVGPEHFAIIPVDCGKLQGRARIADFYGNILLNPFSFRISRAGLETACSLIRQVFKKHCIRDCICAIETTGRYHRPIKTAFRAQGWDVREVHPLTTSLIRRAADMGNKTDDTDLAAVHRAAVDGLAMRPEILDERSQQWRLLARYRRDLVEKTTTLKIQLKEMMHAYLPGYTQLWDKDSFWESPVAVTIATTFASPGAMGEASDEQYLQAVRAAGSKIQRTSINRIRAWAYQAAPAEEGFQIYFRRAGSLWKDLRSKWDEIGVLELELADFLCQSPGVLLLAFPGISVVSASDYVAELGPITNYAKSKSIAGRAGLYPARYQTSDIDHADGPLVARRNRQLRAALMRLAFNLDLHNTYFKSVGKAYEDRHSDHDPKVVIARAFSRLSFYLIAGEKLYPHPAIQHGGKILQKLLEFYQERVAAPQQVTAALNQVIARLSGRLLQAEHAAITEEHRQHQQHRRRTPGLRRMGEILPELLLRLGQRLEEVPHSESEMSESHNPLDTEDVTHGS